MNPKLVCLFALMAVAVAHMPMQLMRERFDACGEDEACLTAVRACLGDRRPRDRKPTPEKLEMFLKFAEAARDCLLPLVPLNADINIDAINNAIQKLRERMQNMAQGNLPGRFKELGRRISDTIGKVGNRIEKDMVDGIIMSTIGNLTDEQRTTVDCCIGQALNFVDAAGQINMTTVTEKFTSHFGAGTPITQKLIAAAEKCAPTITDCNYMNFKNCTLNTCIDDGLVAG